MKKVLLFVLIIFSFQHCKVQKTVVKNEKNIQTVVTTTLDQWHLAAANANFEKYFDLMDNDAVFVGTAKEEVWTKQAFMQFAKPYFDKGKAWKFNKISRNIYPSQHADLVYFDELLSTWMGVCRGSGVMVYKNKQWLIKHYVLSVTVPNDKIQSVIKIIKE
jgi:hypothetical protein